MARDETVHKNAEEFNPDRYAPIEEGGSGEPYPTGPFGFGRRYVTRKKIDIDSVVTATCGHSKQIIDDDIFSGSVLVDI